MSLLSRIEKTRSVLPKLLEAATKVVNENAEGKPRLVVNIDYFFGLLFGKENLALVEKACHPTSERNNACDDGRITRTLPGQ